jgi:hypothetical protein
MKETCQSRRGTKAIQKRYKSKTFLLFSEAALRDYVYSFLDSRGLMISVADAHGEILLIN